MQQPHSKSIWNCVEKEYTLHETLGEGSYGKVRKGIHKLTQFKVAIKKISLPDSAGMFLYNSIIREVYILR